MRDKSLVRKLPKWLYDRVRWDIIYRIQQRIKRHRRYDYDGVFNILGRLTDSQPEAIRSYYAELDSEGIYQEIEDRIRAVRDMTPEHLDLRYLRPEKYFRLDRTALYCIVRAMRPAVFVETGTRFGISSYFIARAMERNGHGQLYTFDIGVEGCKRDYFWPDSQAKIGFLIPERLWKYVTLTEGSSLDTLPKVLPGIQPVDIYYFDSYQAYDHMIAEYRIVFPWMAKNGLFMSEDTDENSAWSDFISDKHFLCHEKYCSHYGITPEREVSAIRLQVHGSTR